MNRRVLAANVIVLAAVAAVLVSFNAPAQIISEQRVRTSAVTDQELMNFDLRAHRSELIISNMDLTPAQAEEFLPIYLDFDAELQNLWNERLKLIGRYAAEYQTIADDQADALLSAMLELDEKHVKIRKKYYREFKSALGGRIAARVMQLDRRLNSLLELQAAQSIPLVR